MSDAVTMGEFEVHRENDGTFFVYFKDYGVLQSNLDFVTAVTLVKALQRAR